MASHQSSPATFPSVSPPFGQVDGAGVGYAAIVVGSGVAGLASAIRLAVQGWQVQVFEKNSYAGGKLSWFIKDGYSFDAGPSLFTQPQLVEELFQIAGEPVDNYFTYEQVPVSCHYFWQNGKQVKAYFDRDKLTTELQEQLGESPASINTYLQDSAKLYQHVGPFFLDHSLHKLKTFLQGSIGKAITASRPGHLLQSLNSYNKSHFKSVEAVQMFNRYATYNGSNPYQAPGMLSIIPHLEMNEGTFYPQGGMISITKALYKLAVKLGVQFQFDTPVQRIVHSNGMVQGIEACGKLHSAAVVVSNSDVYFTYKNLLNDERKAAQTLKQERSSSALIFYWGISKSFPQLGLHNIFFSNEYEIEFQHLFQHKTFSSDATVYINITAKMEPGQAPPGCENWFVMVNAPSTTNQQNWEQMQQQVRQQVIEKLSRMLKTDVASLIQTETILTPPQIEAVTASFAGSLYGTSSNSKLAAFWRHPNFSKSIKGLYFVGGSVHPGGGIPLCLRSAKIMSTMVAKPLNH